MVVLDRCVFSMDDSEDTWKLGQASEINNSKVLFPVIIQFHHFSI